METNTINTNDQSIDHENLINDAMPDSNEHIAYPEQDNNVNQEESIVSNMELDEDSATNLNIVEQQVITPEVVEKSSFSKLYNHLQDPHGADHLYEATDLHSLDNLYEISDLDMMNNAFA